MYIKCNIRFCIRKIFIVHRCVINFKEIRNGPDKEWILVLVSNLKEDTMDICC